MRYRAQTLLWHTAEQRYVLPGDEMALDHLPPDDRQALVTRGMVTEISEPVAAEPAADELDAVPGIGPEYAKALRAAGVRSRSDLVKADAAALEQQIGAVSVKQIKQWQRAAEKLEEQHGAND